MTTVIFTDRAAAVELLRKGESSPLPHRNSLRAPADALNPIAVAEVFEQGTPAFDSSDRHLSSGLLANCRCFGTGSATDFKASQQGFGRTVYNGFAETRNRPEM